MSLDLSTYILRADPRDPKTLRAKFGRSYDANIIGNNYFGGEVFEMVVIFYNTTIAGADPFGDFNSLRA